MPRLTSYGLMAATALLASCTADSDNPPQSVETSLKRPTARLVFNEKGEAAPPRGYRSWVHAYTTWEPITESLLDQEPTDTPEFHHVYVEPNAYRTFMTTGKWPEGTLIVKEFAFTSVDPETCDGPPPGSAMSGSAKRSWSMGGPASL